MSKVSARLMSKGMLFQVFGVSTENALSPANESLDLGTT